MEPRSIPSPAGGEPAVSRRRTLKDRIFFTPVHANNVGSVRLLIDTVLPVRYSDDFYKKLMLTPYDFTKMGT